MSARHNEIEKLTATLFNTLSAACVVAGVISPAAGLGPARDPRVDDWIFVLTSISWLVGGAVIHIGGRAWLEWKLRE